MTTSIRRRFTTLPLAVLGTIAVLAAVPAHASQSEQGASGKGLEGTWRVEVTLRDCNTGAALAAPFRSLLTFARGGTLAETTAHISPALRTPGRGIWQQTGGSTFTSTFEAFLFSPAGVWTNTQRLTQTIEIGDDPNVWTANAHNEIFDTNDNLVMSGCSTAVGHRME
jgi:hypothetical protein